MSESWDEYAATWDGEGTRTYADEAAASLRRQAATFGIPLKDARVLDFGCGTGLLAERLALDVGHIVALDPSKGMTEHVKRKIEAGLKRVEVLEGALDREMLNAPALEKPFDLVVASSVCAFLEHYPQTLSTLAHLMKPGGVFVQWDWEWNASDEEPFGLTREAITSALQGAGFEILFVGQGFETSVGTTRVAPLMGVGRLPERSP